MTIFELVKVALDELYAQGQRQYGTDLDDTIKKRIKYLSGEYGKLHDKKRKPVDYKDPATRFAYVYKYVAAHGDYLVQLMLNVRAKVGGNIFTGEVARVSCVGGGPGSDIIAVLKYLDERSREPVKKVTCYLLDREQAWADTWTELDDALGAKIHLNANFQPLDVTDPRSWEFQQKFLMADVFTMSYFFSEVHALNKNGVVSDFWQTLFKRAKAGALFLYIDNGHELFNDYCDEQWTAAGLRCLMKGDNVHWTPRHSEQASDLGDYRQKFGHQPKLKGLLSYRVLKKK
jgi:hypothetical protein